MIRIGNVSGFYGDRFSAVGEMLEGGEIDVLTGDYLAELTMLILGRDRMANPELGYAKTFLRQMRENLGAAMARRVKIVVNAGGLNPAGLAGALRELAGELGVSAAIAHVEGDDLLERSAEFGFGDEGARPLTANAYLGCWGIAACLDAGSDVVVTGRVTDAALAMGPAAAHFGWGRRDYDQLAGALAAGHVIECGAQATGGNFAFFTELADLAHPGFPIAEIHADGSSVITKHQGTSGAVTVETVTAQLLYEIAGPAYPNPDVTARFDTLSLNAVGVDRVEISGTRGLAPPKTVKVCLNTLDGFRNAMTFVLCGLDIQAKADLVREQLHRRFGAELSFDLARTDHADADTEQRASALLQVTIRTTDAKRAKEFSRLAVEMALASYPGFTMTSPPGSGSPVGVYTAAYVDRRAVNQVAVLPDGARLDIAPAEETGPVSAPSSVPAPVPPSADLASVRAPLGRILGARSGDKGGDANLGVWARTDEAYHWLAGNISTRRLREILPETANLEIDRFELPNLRAVNFVVHGLLGKGVAASTRFDPQAKSLGEWFRSRLVDIPAALLEDE